MDSTEIDNLQPNDVAMVLRPIRNDDDEWDGSFEILISGVGPVTMPEENVRELISMAMLVATTIPMMEKDSDLTEQIMIECAKFYGEADDVDIAKMLEPSGEFTLTINSKTVGGTQ
jgi:hypothetical protein